MNIFYLDPDPKTCAEMHVNKHVVKMIIEYAQLMSTAHRILDGQEYIDKTANGRNIKRWRMADSEFETRLYKASHVNHPSGVWCRANKENYIWLNRMWHYLMIEYTHRYGRQHETSKLSDLLYLTPKNIPNGSFYEPTPAMPDECKVPGDSLASYHKYYVERKNHFAVWTKRETPTWYKEMIDANLCV